jgi:hypothetical protein
VQPPIDETNIRSRYKVLPSAPTEHTESNFSEYTTVCWEHKAQGPLFLKPWRWRRSEVQHLRWRTNQLKKRHLFGAFVFHNLLAPIKAVCPRKKAEYAEYVPEEHHLHTNLSVVPGDRTSFSMHQGKSRY